MKKDAWWSGIIDRFVLRQDAGDCLREAVLIDFKTDRAGNPATRRDGYSKQLTIYRRAISTSLKLRDDQVEGVLLNKHLEMLL